MSAELSASIDRLATRPPPTKKTPIEKGATNKGHALSDFLRHLMAYCHSECSVKYEDDHRLAVSRPCRAWTCNDCAPNRAKQLRALGNSGAPNKFLTLTFKVRKGLKPDDAARMLSWAWRCLRLRMMRKYRWHKLPFLAVFEQTKAGWPHLHILLRSRFIDQKFISDVMAELIESPVVYIEEVWNRRKAVAYVAKYCSKDAHKFGTCKRYWTSKDYDIETTQAVRDLYRKKQGWEHDPQPLHRWMEMCRTFGWSVELTGSYRAIARPPPPAGSPPPPFVP